MRLKLTFILLLLSTCMVSVLAQTTIKGVVVDKDSKEPLIGATVFSTAEKKGTVTDLDGSFVLNLTTDGTQLKISYVGYHDEELIAKTNMGVVELATSAVGLKDVVVTSSIAIRRKTPVALSVIEPEMLEAKLGNQEFPEILKTTPSVYVTKQGGGFGDSRITMRGFGLENTAFMINGVPMNDMEWGGVYMSNWAGLGDVTRSFQVQRGLGASKVAAPSIGGSYNIVTKSTDAEKGGSVYYGMGNAGEQKVSFSVSTGLSKNGWAMTLLGTRNWGEKFAMGTEFEAYTWFVNISKIINENHQLSLTAFGTPQWHNQRNRYNMMTVLEWKKMPGDFRKYNPNFGYDKNGERVDPDHNRYHKPQISLNHSWTIDEKSNLSTVLYASLGSGGGYRWRGTKSSALYGTSTGLQNNGFPGMHPGFKGTLNMEYRDSASPFYRDYGAVQADNESGKEMNVISESINNHTWLGLLSTYSTSFGKNIDFYGGIDLRYYEGLHEEKIRNLMGLTYYKDTNRSKSSKSADWKNQKLGVGDKIYRDNTVYIIQNGIFAQAEYNKEALSAFVSGAVSAHTYWKNDDYYFDSEDAPSKTFIAFNVKTGANYNIDENHNLFFNTGYMSRAPYIRSGFMPAMDQSNAINENAVNEKSYSFEVGYGFRTRTFTADLNLYYTKWLDKTTSKKFDTDAFMNVTGVDARHMGVELEMTYKPIRDLTLKGMIAIGDWIWDSKGHGAVFNEKGEPSSDGSNTVEPGMNEVWLDLKDVKINNAPQTTFSVSATYKLFNGLTIGGDYTYAMRNYADYTIEIPNMGQTLTYYTPWRIPSAGTLDLFANYKFDIMGLKATFYANVNNVLNKEYIADAKDFNATSPIETSWQEVGVMYAFGRTWWTGLKVQF